MSILKVDYGDIGGGSDLLEVGKYLNGIDGVIEEIVNGSATLHSGYGSTMFANIEGLGYTSVGIVGSANGYSYNPIYITEDGIAGAATGTAGTGSRTFTFPNNVKYIQILVASNNTGGVTVTINFS